MKTFDMSASLDFRVVVPDQFTNALREQAKADDASPFLIFVQNEHPEDDDEFILTILRNGFKRYIRNSVLDLCKRDGLGGSFSPVVIKDRTPPKSEPTALETVKEAIPQ